MSDAIVEETRKWRDEYAAMHGYDVHRIAADLREWAALGFPRPKSSVVEQREDSGELAGELQR